MSTNTPEQDPLLHYYTQELNHLRKMGAVFAARYPKIATRLELDKDGCTDPHIERLIEAFAFLTGRIQYNIDSEFVKFTSALLDTLYPHYLQPIPALTIAQFEIDPTQGQFTGGLFVPKDTGLSTIGSAQRICQFRTSYPLTLWPLAVTEARFEPREKYDFINIGTKAARVLRLRLTTQQDLTLKELIKLDRLRIHLNESWLEVGPLYELLFGEVSNIVLLSPENQQWVNLPLEALKPVGFEEDENILPYPKHAHPSYSLLQEYFVFPDKFLFFDLEQIDQLFKRNEQGVFSYIQTEQRSFDILFLLKAQPNSILEIDENSFKLGCAPIINLFSKISEPLRVDHRRTEYRLIPDGFRERTTEIHSVVKVSASLDVEDNSTEVQPFFSFKHNLTDKQHNAFWLTRRVPTQRVDLSGTDILLSFLELDFTPTLPPQQTVFAHTLCTNRDLAEQVQAGTELQLDNAGPLKNIFCLRHPTIPSSPTLGGNTVWRIISHLSLNYLSLTDTSGSLAALQEILRLYNPNQDKSIERQIAGIRTLSVERKIGRLGPDAWRGFVRGFEITLEFDRDFYRGSSALLFSGVLERFFALYVSANSFTRLIIKEEHSPKEDIWKKWSPRPGIKIQL